MSSRTEAMPAQNKIIQAIGNYGRQLFGFIRNRVSTNEDAEDILQDVWYQLSKQTGVEDIESISGWLYRVARNRITDTYRKKKDDLLEDLYPAKERNDSVLDELLTGDTEHPESGQMRELFREELLDALEELPEKQRKVFIWNEMEEMTLQQIADQEGENIKTIISRKNYAVKYLRQRLETLYNEIIYY